MSYFPNAAIQTIGAAIPPAAELMGGSDGTDIRALLVSVTGQLHTLVDNFPATQPVSGTVAATQSGVWTVGISGGQTIAVTNAGTFAVQDAAAEASLATLAGTVSGGKINVALASTTITGSVAVTGTFFQATQPVSGTVTALQGTSPWVVSGTVTVTPSGLQNVNLTQLNSVALGSPSNYGTSPGAVEVLGVNAFITNTPAVTLASTTITGTVAVTQSTSPWVTDVTQWANVALGSPSNYGTSPGAVEVIGVNAFITNTVPVTLASTTITGTVAVTQSTSPWVVSLTSTTITGTVNENLIQVAGATLGSTAVTNFGTAPAAAAVPGVNASLYAGVTGLTVTGTSLNVNVTNTVPVTLTSTTITGTVAVTQSTSPWVISGTVTTTPSGLQNVNLTELNTVALGSPSNYGTSPGVVAVQGVNAFVTNTVATTLASTTITGTVAVTQSTSPWVISGTVTTTPSGLQNVNLTELNTVALGSPSNYGTSPGAIAVQGVNAFVTNTVATTLASTTITGTVAVTQSTSPWVTDVTQWANVALGAPSNYGTPPGAVEVIGVNAFVTNAIVVNNISSVVSVQGSLTNNNAAPGALNLGVLPAVANAANPALVEGNQVLLSEDLTGHLRVTGPTSSTASAPANTAVTSTASVVLAANTARLEFTITNTSVVPVYLAFNTKVPTATAFHIMLSPCGVAFDGTGGTFTSDLIKGQVQAIVASTAGTVSVLELTV